MQVKLKPILEAIKVIPEIIKVKGRGLMLGEFDFDVSA
jgi:acetylornithine aminotransferase